MSPDRDLIADERPGGSCGLARRNVETLASIPVGNVRGPFAVCFHRNDAVPPFLRQDVDRMASRRHFFDASLVSARRELPQVRQRLDPFERTCCSRRRAAERQACESRKEERRGRRVHKVPLFEFELSMLDL